MSAAPWRAGDRLRVIRNFERCGIEGCAACRTPIAGLMVVAQQAFPVGRKWAILCRDGERVLLLPSDFLEPE